MAKRSETIKDAEERIEKLKKEIFALKNRISYLRGVGVLMTFKESSRDRNYKVTLSVTFEVCADNEDEAIDEAYTLLEKEMDSPMFDIREYFEANVEESSDDVFEE